MKALNTFPKVVLKPEKERPVLLGSPWIFSGAIGDIRGSIEAGCMVEVQDSSQDFLAWGYYNPDSQIAIRVLSRAPEEFPNEDLVKKRIEDAISTRFQHFDSQFTDIMRLVNSEGDFLPGLVVDRYGRTLVVQILTRGMERFREVVINTLLEILHPSTIWERSDSSVRKKEGLEPKTELLWGDDRHICTAKENGNLFVVDVRTGQKTGFYIDQRENRREVQRYCRGATVLNCFAYTGAFSVYAHRGGARHITNVEFSPSAMELLNENSALNQIPGSKQENILGDAFEVLRELRKKGAQFDLVIVDPPKFAHSQAQLKQALKGYKDINLQALHLIKRGGMLATFSCSGAVTMELFSKAVLWAAMDARREMKVLKRLGQPLDHPFVLGLPESEYLKGLLIKVL